MGASAEDYRDLPAQWTLSLALTCWFIDSRHCLRVL